MPGTSINQPRNPEGTDGSTPNESGQSVTEEESSRLVPGRTPQPVTKTSLGTYIVTFTATNSAGASSTGNVTIQVDSPKPVVTAVLNGATQTPQNVCSPGSVASLTGVWLASTSAPVSDPSGASQQLGGTRVNINGNYVPVLYASVQRVDFQCPNVDPGTVLSISAETSAGVTNSVQTTMQPLTPGLYSADGSGQGQGMVTFLGTSLLTTIRSYLTSGQPAEAGDAISILATGIGSGATQFQQVQIAGSYVSIDSVQPMPGMAGAYQINVTVPAGVPVGDAVPVVLLVTAPDGTLITSNTVTIAVEASRQ
jgi:uncharacterized protein (TIGR03437 family)